MKYKSKLPLRWRITLMTGAVVLVSNFCMMMVSVHYANNGFDVVLTNVSDYYENSMAAPKSEVVMNDNESQIENEEIEEQKSAGAFLKNETEDFRFNDLMEEVESLNSSSVNESFSSSFPDSNSVSRAFNLISVVTMIGTTLMGMIIAYLLSARALRPISELNQSVLSITGSNLNRRVEESGIPDEVGSLQKSFNGMMNRLESSFHRQKEFSRNVAHELKTPLTTMKTGIQVLRMDEHPDTEEIMQVLSVTEKNIDRLISIVQDLLMFTNDQVIEFHDEIELGSCLLNVIHEQKSFAKLNQVKLSLKCSQDIQVIQNEALLTRAFSNLIENAIKYNKKDGYVEITVMKKQTHAVVEIKDTGIGMEPDQLERIWEPFYCVEPSRSRASGGAGIGLALVRSISEKCGFDVKVTSIKGQGSVFTVEIPYEL